jgi:ATP-dependent protease HslVU (ClpYQ) peptidase subunit
MSLFIAVKKKTICVAYDSLYMLPGSRCVLHSEIESPQKVVIKERVIFCPDGDLVFVNILENYLTDTKNLKFETQQDVFTFMLSFHQALKDKYYLDARVEDNDAFETSHCKMLIITPEKIFQSYQLRSVVSFPQYQAVGDGASYALGALEAIYSEIDTAQEVACRALEIAAKFENYIAIPAQVIDMTKL